MVKKIRVAMIMGKMAGGGVEAVVMNYYCHINREQFQFDFFVDEDSTFVPEAEILGLGGRIYWVPPYQKIIAYRKALTKIFKAQHYDIVHSHLNALSVFPLRVAKSCGISIRIAHNHSTSAPGEIKKNLMKSVLRLFSNVYPTHFMSPTKSTGKWLFGKRVAEERLFILKNAIEINRFAFDEIRRIEIRKELGFRDEEVVIGNIGRMVWQKNQKFALEVFVEFLKIEPNARFLMIGDGPLESEIVSFSKNKQLFEKIIFLRKIENIQNYYQAMDALLFPSNYEGLGMVAIEAQCSGLPVFASDKVPDEARLSDLFIKIPLKLSPNIWKDKMKSSLLMLFENERKSRVSEISNQGYSISESANKLTDYYLELLTKNR